ncbi:MAG: hypothetical protein QOE65_1861 [Solirubrobacteraceae bacterium]|jgi:hypothetical protein|nr:hypothetical protein [Solirubrobacteraceae bacterium]
METVQREPRRARDVPRWLWDELRADPTRAPEHIALAAAEIHAPSAARWMARRQGRGVLRRRSPEAHARAAVRAHVRLARVAGAATGLGGWTTIALDLATLAWIQSRMVFFVAAAHGWDPADPMRPAELLVLQQVYDDPYEARAALDGTGRRIAQAYVGNLGSADGRLVGRLVRMVGGHAVQRLGGKAIPGLASIVNAVVNGGETKRLGRRAREFYGGRTA